MTTKKSKARAAAIAAATAHHQSGKKPARSKADPDNLARKRLSWLFDEGKFEEIGAEVTNRSQDFGLDQKRIPGDGVITACGKIHGRPVFAFSQDKTVLGGSLGEAHALKITRLQDLALKSGAPLIAINDSGGARIQEGVNALFGYGEIFRRNVMASGVIPQISLIMGPCAGGAVYSPALTDFVGMVEGSSYMFLTGPKVVKQVMGEDISVEELGGAHTHANETGVANLLWQSDEEAIAETRRLLSYLPASNSETPPTVAGKPRASKLLAKTGSLVPGDPKKSYEVRDVIDAVMDADSFYEIHASWARNIVTGFARLGGHTVGVVANNPAHMAGVLDINASRKGARFIRTCNAFNIPLISLVDVPGFLPGSHQEHGGVIDHGAKLLYAYCEACVPKLAVILRKAYGGAYIVMSSKHVGGDINLAWPGAEIAVMGSAGAVEILNRREITEADDPAAKKQALQKVYEDKFLNPTVAASYGYLDAVIEPAQTRDKLLYFLELTLNKQEAMPDKRNGNIPT